MKIFILSKVFSTPDPWKSKILDSEWVQWKDAKFSPHKFLSQKIVSTFQRFSCSLDTHTLRTTPPYPLPWTHLLSKAKQI